MAMVKRIAASQPDQLVNEIARLREERENLRQALTLKLSEYVGKLPLDKCDTLKLRKPPGMSKELATEVMEGLADRLRDRYDWNGVILVEELFVLGKLDVESEKAIFKGLHRKFGWEGNRAKH